MDKMLNMREMEGLEIDKRYRLDRFLDEGMFGAVFKASHFAYGVKLRDVAIKVAKQSMTKSEARVAFSDALIMTQVVDSTPDAELREHFVTVHDAGHCQGEGPLEGHPYMVMELITGGSLQKCLSLGPFPLKRVINYFDQILKAVAFMHTGMDKQDDSLKPVQIVHRDLKPGNILVTRHSGKEDLIKITDFGLAIQIESLLGWAESGGDLAYLAPESFSHNICSPQSDVYMLGLIFHEMVVGKNPFSQVGVHLSRTSSDHNEELRKIHIAARQMETFPLLEEHYELRERPALCKVVRTALASDMTSRTYNNAWEFKVAWDKAKKDDFGSKVEESSEFPWHDVRKLTSDAEQCFAAGDRERAGKLLEQAMRTNRDKAKVPDNMIVGKAYRLMVQILLQKEKLQEAGALAAEGYSRKRCRSTCQAMAYYYGKINPKMGLKFESEVKKYPSTD